MSLSRFAKGQPLCDQWLYLPLLQQVEQGEQAVPKPCGFQPHQPLDTVRHHALAARQKLVPEDIPPQDRGFTNRVPPAWRTRSEPSSVQLGLESVDHNAAAFAERFARAP